jgi:hypothetical protein
MVPPELNHLFEIKKDFATRAGLASQQPVFEQPQTLRVVSEPCNPQPGKILTESSRHQALSPK